MNNKIRFTEIDLLRFLAAFSVMFFHYTMIIGKSNNVLIPSVNLPYLTAISRYGYLGIDLFFFISGFVILMTAMDRSAKDFVISRMVRLYPTFWACCTLTFLIALFFGIGTQKLSFWRYILNIPMLHGFFSNKHLDGVYWTLFIEMKFYFLIFLLIFFKKINHLQYYLGIWLAISIILVASEGGKWIAGLEYLLIPKYSTYFIAGAVSYLIYREGPSFYKLMLLFGSYLLALSNATFILNAKIIKYHMPFNIFIVGAIISALYLSFLLISFKKTVSIRSDVYILIGALTYPLYLLHAHIGFIVFSNPYLHRHLNQYVLLVSAMALMLCLAYFVHAQVEVKFSPVFKKWLQNRLNFTHVNVNKKIS